MGFVEAWGFDPEEISRVRRSADEFEQRDLQYNAIDEQAARIPSDSSAQVSELWRMLQMEESS